MMTAVFIMAICTIVLQVVLVAYFLTLLLPQWVSMHDNYQARRTMRRELERKLR